jgi:hypothetical protein
MKRYSLLTLLILFSLVTNSQTRDSIKVSRIDSLVNSYIENLKSDTTIKESVYSGNLLKKRFIVGKKKIGEFKFNVIFRDNLIYIFQKEVSYYKTNKRIITKYSFENNKLIRYEGSLALPIEERDNSKAWNNYEVKVYFDNSNLIRRQEKINHQFKHSEYSEKEILEMAKIELTVAFEIAKYYDTKKGYFFIVDNE